jgi:predicted nucleic acid-binding protein
MVRAQKAGLALGSMDAFVAATAATRALTLVTRNVEDFERLGVGSLGVSSVKADRHWRLWRPAP